MSAFEKFFPIAMKVLDIDKLPKIKLKKYLDELCTVASNMDQIHFQRLVGLIEVLGELIIKSK